MFDHRIRWHSKTTSPSWWFSITNLITGVLDKVLMQGGENNVLITKTTTSRTYQVADGLDCIIVTPPFIGTSTDKLLIEHGADMQLGL